jgi:triacylglycerol lipase
MTAAPFDPKAAVAYGRFVQAAYTMYDSNPDNLTPPQSADFPAGYQLSAWIIMRDFILTSTKPVFYGFVAHSITNPNQLVLAIRGTSNGIEWWDDANAILKTPFKVPGCGEVGTGFARIYDTLEVIEHPIPIAAAAPRSLKPAGSFSQQVSELVRSRAKAAPRREEAPASVSIEVTGHSLGGALATLYTMENAKIDKLPNPAICTFASPLVGDSTFAAAFDTLQLTSWRVVNAQDLVPMLPPHFLGFTHVATEQLYSSIGKVRPSLSCWHALATYLSLIDPALQPGADCAVISVAAAAPRAAAPAPAVTTLSVPAGPVTINITVNVGK